jgi:hypothetical protein
MDTTLAIRSRPDVSQSSAVRRARYRRDMPPPLRLTPDDLAIIRHVAKHRFLRSTHLMLLLDRPPKKLLERLAALYHNAYLDRPRAQLDYYATAGSAPMVYGLGNKGAAILAETDNAPRARVDWTDKNRTAGRAFIAHTLMIADVMVALEIAIRRRSDVRFVAAEDILAAAPEATRRLRNPWKLSATLKHAGAAHAIGIIPDKVFGLDFTQARKRSYFFLEADRATMPVIRSHPRQTSFQQKILAYLAGGGASNAHGARLGIGNFRVLTVTTSRERLQTMWQAQHEASKGGSRQFLFVDHGALRACPDLLTLEWRNGKGEMVQLTP